MIKKIIKFVYKKYLKITKSVIIERHVNYTVNSFFEGNNKINANTIISNSTIGFGTYIGMNSMMINAKIGRYCSIANNVKTIVSTHPTHDFVSTHPAFFSIHKQARIYLCKQTEI